ncbi:YceD family protein [Roseibium suaedae]|uniref:Uncharacterized metal-binding protein YceD, DUF177 family n=1 Tax=Roseibium suaedae TaxID=735517 RepID=A0A1M7CYJ7_9HYPH|nr:DUF177 domain-containing protein [Roseibium suaedae]SHL71959.1 Uncharacterized metal-binding protein YceD, DUF177 family [Roseibium suaedae]
MAKASYPYSYKVNGDRLGDQVKPVKVVPDEAELARIAKAYDVDGIESLTADLVLKPWRKDGVRVAGTLVADVRQICVVTLEPFVQRLTDEIDRTFEPVSTRPRRPKDLNDDGEIEIDLEGIDPPDVMIDGVLDLGALICEQLALNIDPFPRKPGAEFDDVVEDAGDEGETAEEKPSPFAALAKLKGEEDS